MLLAGWTNIQWVPYLHYLAGTTSPKEHVQTTHPLESGYQVPESIEYLASRGADFFSWLAQQGRKDIHMHEASSLPLPLLLIQLLVHWLGKQNLQFKWQFTTC
jgi:hypothetical protein